MAKTEQKKTVGKIVGHDRSEINPSKKAPAMMMRGFRLTPNDAAIFDQKVARSGRTHSEFFRLAVIGNKTVVHEKVKIPAINHEVLHLLLKQGNNLNQIARSLNEAKLAGTINPDLFRSVLRELTALNETSRSILNNTKVS